MSDVQVEDEERYLRLQAQVEDYEKRNQRLRAWRQFIRQRLWIVIDDMHNQLGHVGKAEECFRPWCYELRLAVERGEH